MLVHFVYKFTQKNVDLKSENIVVFLRWDLVLSNSGATDHKIEMGTCCWATKPPPHRYQKHTILKSTKTTSKLHFVNIFGLTQFLQIKALIMSSSYSNSSPSNSPIILDSEASTIVISIQIQMMTQLLLQYLGLPVKSVI